MIPEKVKVEIKAGVISVEGSKGKLTQKIHPAITVSVDNGCVLVARKDDLKINKSLHGLSRALIANMIKGVTNGYSKELDIIGVGYRAQMEGDNLVMQLGFSHPVIYSPSKEVKLEIIKQTKIIISGLDKAIVGQVAAEIRRIKPPEPYKGTGIKYTTEHIRRKLGKAAGTK